jgi:hypothetical protein
MQGGREMVSFTQIKKVLVVTAVVLSFSTAVYAARPEGKGGGGGNGKPVAIEGNNLSFPVIWAEGVAKALRGTEDMIPILNGEWWYHWGTYGIEPDTTPASCPPDPEDQEKCSNGLDPGTPEADAPQPLVKAYVQKHPDNIWQAGFADGSRSDVNVDWIDWGDNLESVDWYLRSKVRTEVVLFKDLGDEQMTEYEMRHVSGWGIDEVHGLAATPVDSVPEPGPGDQATIFSPCARLTIQKLVLPRGSSNNDYLVWDYEEKMWVNGDEYEGDALINEPIFNTAVHEANDGPGYYNAEVNVKGRIIYGYTWNVRQLNDGAGDYRITFSFDEVCGTVDLNTFFVDGTTEIIVPLEEEIEAAVLAAESTSTEGGAVPVLDFENNLTYVDVRITER